MKVALITGISGQDGAYLARFLLQKKYKVIGLTRSIINFDSSRLEYLGILRQISVVESNKHDVKSYESLLREFKPKELYNLGAQSSVGASFLDPYDTVILNVNTILSWLEAIRNVDSSIRLYQASSSEMYGNVDPGVLPINEGFVFNPASPYAISKAAGHWLVSTYRQAYGLNACCGILFNHESVLRGENYVVRKVISQAMAIKSGVRKEKIKLGNIEIVRDWGYAPRYVEAMWKMLQIEEMQDFHICSGEAVSLRELIELVLKELELKWEETIEISDEFKRLVDLSRIEGDNSLAKQSLDWSYNMSISDLVKKLIEDEKAYIRWKKRK